MLLQGEGRDQPHFSLLITRFSLVSVPLRGKGRDQHLIDDYDVDRIYEEFPSPCGEKVGINRRLVRQQNSHNNGEVSVPLRGKGRDQRRWHLAHRGQVRLAVSVPLRGKGRDQPTVGLLTSKGTCKTWEFPSPCGEKVGINRLVSEGSEGLSGTPVSVPLRGKGRDQLCLMGYAYIFPGRFPSPCGEKVGINPTLGKA